MKRPASVLCPPVVARHRRASAASRTGAPIDRQASARPVYTGAAALNEYSDPWYAPVRTNSVRPIPGSNCTHGIAYGLSRRSRPKDQAQGPPSPQGPLGRLLPHRRPPRQILRRQRTVPGRRALRGAPLGATARYPRQAARARPGQLRAGAAGTSPRAGPGQPQARPRRRRPAGRRTSRPRHPDLRGGGRQGARHPRRDVEGRGQERKALAGDAGASTHTRVWAARASTG